MTSLHCLGNETLTQNDSSAGQTHSSEGDGRGPGVWNRVCGTPERIAAAGFATGAGVAAGAAAAESRQSTSIGCAFSFESARTTGPARKRVYVG